jgi:hypothetical protein
MGTDFGTCSDSGRRSMTDEIPGTTPGEVEGYQPPAEPASEAPPSEIPEGVDALPAEAVAAAAERSGGDDGDDGALDVSAVVQGGGDDADADASGDADADASSDADADADADADPQAGAPADDVGEDATQKTDVEAPVAPDTGEAG